jgi:transcriptional regulator with XRE-family HTH domain
MYTIDYRALGARIRAERRRREITQEKLAEMVDISVSFMGHVERGGRTLSIETLIKLANVLELSIEYLVGGEFNYQPAMLPRDIQAALDKLTSSQRKVLLNQMATLAEYASMWPV